MRKYQRSMFGLLLLGLCLVPSWVQATEVNVYSGPASSGQPLEVFFTTSVAGEVKVQVQWTPKTGAKYILFVEHLAVCGDLYSQDVDCAVNSYFNAPLPGDWTCSIPVAPAGCWHAQFRVPKGGKVQALETITAETN